MNYRDRGTYLATKLNFFLIKITMNNSKKRKEYDGRDQEESDSILERLKKSAKLSEPVFVAQNMFVANKYDLTALENKTGFIDLITAAGNAAEKYKCVLCFDILRNPIEFYCRCANSVCCMNCYLTNFKLHPNVIPKCPSCRAILMNKHVLMAQFEQNIKKKQNDLRRAHFRDEYEKWQRDTAIFGTKAEELSSDCSDFIKNVIGNELKEFELKVYALEDHVNRSIQSKKYTVEPLESRDDYSQIIQNTLRIGFTAEQIQWEEDLLHRKYAAVAQITKIDAICAIAMIDNVHSKFPIEKNIENNSNNNSGSFLILNAMKYARPLPQLTNEINELPCKCIWHERGCAWVGKLSELNTHRQSDCDFQPMRCCAEVFPNRAAHSRHVVEMHLKKEEKSIAQQVKSYYRDVNNFAYTQAVYLIANKRYEEALPKLNDLCNANNPFGVDPRALVLLGHLYTAKNTPTIVNPNQELATRLYKAAADMGHPRGQYYYAASIAMNQSQKWLESYDYLTSAAQSKDTFALYSLGVMYELGQIVEKNYDSAYELFMSAASDAARRHVTAMRKVIHYCENNLCSQAIAMSAAEKAEQIRVFKMLIDVSTNTDSSFTNMSC